MESIQRPGHRILTSVNWIKFGRLSDTLWVCIMCRGLCTSPCSVMHVTLQPLRLCPDGGWKQGPWWEALREPPCVGQRDPGWCCTDPKPQPWRSGVYSLLCLSTVCSLLEDGGSLNLPSGPDTLAPPAGSESHTHHR